MEEVQEVSKEQRESIQKIFFFYAKQHKAEFGQPPQEPSMNGPAFLRCLKDCKLVTRKGDMRHDFSELMARTVFTDVQMEEEEAGASDVGGGDDEMIYMEFLEALAAIACYKFLNPYVPLHAKLDEFLKDRMFPPQEKLALKKKKKKKGKK